MKLSFGTIKLLGVCLLAAGELLCQIPQDHPELCGRQRRPVPLPVGIAASVNPANGLATLTIDLDGNSKHLDLPGPQNEIQEVCPIADDRLLIFRLLVGYTVDLIDQKTAMIADSFMSYSPAISPDRHWLAMQQFRAPNPEVPISDEYLLYNLLASSGSNRHPVGRYTPSAPSWQIYPVVADNAPVDPLDVPEAQTHRFRSSSFFWSQDGRFVTFADSVQNLLSVVLSSVSDGKITTWVYPVSSPDVCTGDAPPDTSDLTMKGAEVTSVGGSPVVVADFASADSLCVPRQLTLTPADFTLAAPEAWPHRKLKAATLIKRN